MAKEKKAVRIKEVQGEEFPEVGTFSKFHCVAVGTGFVVYNPAGQRVSGILDSGAADDLALRHNTAQHLK